MAQAPTDEQLDGQERLPEEVDPQGAAPAPEHRGGPDDGPVEGDRRRGSSPGGAVAGLTARVGRRWPWLALCGILIVHLVVNAVWLARDETMRGFDEPLHITAQTHAANLVAAHGLSGVWQVLRGRRAGQWPSAGYLPWVPLSLVFGHSIFALRMFNLVYLALLLWAVYRVGERLCSPSAGVLSAALVTFYPAVFGAGRQFNHDLPYVAVVAMNVALILSTERFSRLGRSVLLGAGLGLAVLVRPHALIFLFAPAAYWGVLSLVRPGGTVPRWRVLLHGAACCATGALVCAPWWVLRVDTIQLILLEHVTGRVNLPWMTDPSIVFYTKSFPSGSSPLLLGVGALGLLGLVVSRFVRRPGTGACPSPLGRRPAETAMLGVWLVLGLGAISVFSVHLTRYQFPLYPALALISGVGIAALPWRAARLPLAGLSVALGMFVWLSCSFVEDRPLSEQLHSCDPCNSRPRGERWASSGTPDTDSIIVAMEELADKLEAVRGTGEGLLVHMHPHLRMALMMKPVLMTRLPLLQITHRPLDEYGRDQRNEECESLHQTLGGFSMPLPHLPWDRCFTLKVDFRYPGDAETPPEPVPEARRMHEISAHWGGGIVRFNLWEHPTCPPRDPPHIDPRTGEVVIPCP